MPVKRGVETVGLCTVGGFLRLKGKQLIHLGHGGKGFAVRGSGKTFVLLIALRGLGVEAQGVEHRAAAVAAAGLGRQGCCGQQAQADSQRQQDRQDPPPAAMGG